MKRTLFLLIALLTSHLSMKAQYLHQADSLFEVAAYSKAKESYEKAFQNKETASGDQLYYLAVCHAQLNDVGSSITALHHALAQGLDDPYFDYIKHEQSLNPIRHTTQWQAFIEEMEAPFRKAAQSITHPQYRHQLLQLWYNDQHFRSYIPRRGGGIPNAVAKALDANDRYHTWQLQQIVEEIGWPTHDKVGKDGAHAAWGIIQHATFNPPFMRKCLALMEEAYAQKQVDGVDYAYLYDRFAAISKKKQKFGILWNYPIEDEHLVLERRKEAGFKISLAEYRGEESYTPPSKEGIELVERQMKADYNINSLQAREAFAAKNYTEAISHFHRVLKCSGLVQIKDIYNAAQCYSLDDSNNRNLFRGIGCLKALAARGYSDVEALQNDPHLKRLLEHKGAKEILQSMEKGNKE